MQKFEGCAKMKSKLVTLEEEELWYIEVKFDLNLQSIEDCESININNYIVL